MEICAEHEPSAGCRILHLLFRLRPQFHVVKQILLTYLHPREVTLNGRVSHGAAEWIRAPSNDAEMRSGRLDVCLLPRLRCRFVLAHLRDTQLDGPRDSVLSYINVAMEKMSFYTRCCNKPKSSKNS